MYVRSKQNISMEDRRRWVFIEGITFFFSGLEVEFLGSSSGTSSKC